MIIKDERTPDKATIDELDVGAVFEVEFKSVYEGIYMKLDKENHGGVICVDLRTGVTYTFSKDTAVRSLYVEFTIKG